MEEKHPRFTEFVRAVEAKLDRGKDEHGSESFGLGTSTLIEELQNEALDLAGWGWLLWKRLEDFKDRCGESLEQMEIDLREPSKESKE